MSRTRSCGRRGPARMGRRSPGRARRTRSSSGSARVEPQVLVLGVGLDELDGFVGSAGESQVAQGLVVDREVGAGGAELWAHVGDGEAVGQRGRSDSGSVELDELPDDPVLAQHLGDGEDQVGGGRTFGELAVQPEPDDPWQQHRERLAEHDGFGLDAADAPAEDTEPVDHRGVRVGAEADVGIGPALVRGDDAGQVLDVDLVHDPGAGRDDGEVVGGVCCPHLRNR